MAEWDPTTKQQVQKIPLLTVKAGPRDEKEEWQKRLKEVGRGTLLGCRCLPAPPPPPRAATRLPLPAPLQLLLTTPCPASDARPAAIAHPALGAQPRHRSCKR